MLGKLSAKYESNGNSLCVSSGVGDLGGKSYGAYQFASTYDVPEDFMQWCRDSGESYKVYIADRLCEHVLYTEGFDECWQSFEKDKFLVVQHEYVKEKYYDVACELLKAQYFNAEKHSKAMQDVIWSRAVQYGPAEVPNLFNESLDVIYGGPYPNLSYVDNFAFDYDLIVAIYNTNKSSEWISASLSEDVRNGVLSRMDAEQSEALKMFSDELEGRK